VGKSNFIAVFKFLNKLIQKDLQHHILTSGGAERFFHFGSKETQEISICLNLPLNRYEVSFKQAMPDELVFTEEKGIFFASRMRYPNRDYKEDFASRNKLESGLPTPNPSGIGGYIASYMDGLKVYHFHDTGDTAPVKRICKTTDCRRLLANAENLAAMLYRFKISEKYYHCYEKIVDSITLVAPFFHGFILEPNENDYIRLKWKHRGSEKDFDAYDLSDGTLRFICLATLLQQPLELMPQTILIDEPELGLHPHAIQVLAGMIKSVAKQEKQVIASSQSVTLINEFNAEDILVVDRKGDETVFTRLDEEEIKEWLEDFSIGEIWEKNIIGGTPDDF
ncbi:MAG: AAA family ATPase, partial [Alphaproteobacteria bacterium]|nr:AAA family ATPase [Alphaproteobacteria bacterium]